MLGYVVNRARKGELPPPQVQGMPADLRARLRKWVDVDEVGAEGFWLWLKAVVPLLPHPENPRRRALLAYASRRDELEDLQRRIAVYAREQSRLAVVCGHYVRDNRLLTRRLKALEAALRTLEMAGNRIEIRPDSDAEDAAARYPTAPGPGSRRSRRPRDIQP